VGASPRPGQQLWAWAGPLGLAAGAGGRPWVPLDKAAKGEEHGGSALPAAAGGQGTGSAAAPVAGSSRREKSRPSSQSVIPTPIWKLPR